MKIFGDLRLLLGRMISLILPSASLAISLGSSPPSWSETMTSTPPSCSWPLEVSGHGLTNIGYPDTDATYWVMPVDTSSWKSMILTGQYTQSRFFSFTTYYSAQQTSPRVVDAIIDADIAPDTGSSNPFAPSAAVAPHNYTVTFDANSAGSGNHVSWASDQTTYVFYRIYAADRGLGREAGVPLPTLTLVDTSGNQHLLAQCSSAVRVAAELQELLTALQGSHVAETCPTTTPQSGALTFTTGGGGAGRFPNPVTKYYSASNLCLQPDQVIVVRGQAPDFPNTYDGGTIYQPDFPGSIQMRYWSMCNNKEVTPGPVVACMADYVTQLDEHGFYTYVISYQEAGATPSTPPAWVPAGATWLNWGDPLIRSTLTFRDMLPEAGFTLTGSYLPTGVHCDRRLLIARGWQACFVAAGVTPP
jgi:hypothetical protein